MPRSKVGSSNGGVIGKTNKASFGKDIVTSKTSSGNVCLQSGTRIVSVAVIAGGGGVSGGGGGFRLLESVNAQGTVPVTIGGGGCFTYSEADAPATRPNTTHSSKAEPPRRLRPWIPPANSPAANNPGITRFEPSYTHSDFGLIARPPIV